MKGAFMCGLSLGCRVLAIGIVVGGGGAFAQPSKHAPTAIDWPQFRYDDHHTGYQPNETGLSKKTLRLANLSWQAQLGEPVYASSPAIVNGIVYIGSKDGVLWAYPADGCGTSFCDTPLWQSSSLAQIVDSPTVANGIVYVGSQTDADSNDGKLNAFSAAGCGASVCDPLWQGEAGPESITQSSPAVANGVVYVGTFGHQLFAFNADGCGQKLCQPLWSGQTGGSIESTPAVYKGTVYVGSDDGKLYAFKAKGCHKTSCKPIWTGKLGSAPFTSSPAISKGVVYIGAAHSLSAFDANGCGAKTCAPLWQAVDNDNFFAGSPAVAKGLVYIGWESEVWVYDAKGCAQAVCNSVFTLFGSGTQASIQSSPTVANGVVYAGRNTGEVLAWPAKGCGQASCMEIWKGSTGDSIVNSSPTVVNGKIYIGSADDQSPENISGRIYVYGIRK
jgi:outer membrane protein assembly factor BamB